MDPRPAMQHTPDHQHKSPGHIDETEIDRRFLYHAPTAETRGVHEEVRALTRSFAHTAHDLIDNDQSREVSLFFTALEEASFWLHAHIARNRQ